MKINRRIVILCAVVCSILAGAFAHAGSGPGVHVRSGAVSNARPVAAQDSAVEKTVWDLEHAYWHYAEANDLTAYLTLWHADFLGWPSLSAAPARKDHITDWLTSQTSKGLALKLVEFKPAAMQITGDDLAVACYWATSKWTDQAGAGEPQTIRITHVWIKNGKDWQIIGGMSMPENR